MPDTDDLQAPPDGPRPNRARRLLGKPRRSWPLSVARALALVAVLLACVWLGAHPSYLPPNIAHLVGAGAKADVPRAQSSQVDEALRIIQREFWRKPDMTLAQDAAISAAVATLRDPYASYQPPAAQAAYRQAMNGQYAGIGIQVKASGRGARIVQVTPASPADTAGLQAGDVISAVDGRPVASRAGAQRAVDGIRGKAGSVVAVTVRRHARSVTRRIRRAELALALVNTTYARTPDGRKAAIIGLSSFAGGAGVQVRDAVTDARRSGAKAIVLDLRGNPGGQVAEAVDVTGVFVKSGVVVSLRGRAQQPQTMRVGGHPADTTTPMAVLTDQASASAAEITAAALQDHARAVVVGTRTYGKGVFQQLFALSGGGALDITVGEFYTPQGRNLGGGGEKRGRGVTPDVAAPADTHTTADDTLEAALAKVGR